ncbi:sugar transferase, PEP-CTERM/EpsH1 system associated [Noviherbaspirillum humi]|uniref:Sugar transferase, PEP-CTERM/EpsH1 system associated n=1 Tax=Noviherbaspirillum humi TaxID=1688639 RepID=A0A239HJG0_9BURK|nr:TIGR03087 family PEP-CTERM/XrtA system glycosyltransferase [Noviherbaspirillum humi]SNS81480.1 sugar transferase, PEP-CTERM/EpsH1 system associated [Noviherbaspirillum humi]
MDPLLFLVHRIPYPPNKGDKIRSYHLLKHLARQYRVYLGSFVDDPNDWQYADAVKALCADTCLLNLDPRIGRLRSLTGLAAGRPLSLDYYRSNAMQDWVNRVTAAHKVSRVVVFSSVMAQFVNRQANGRLIVDYVDVDSDKWTQYAANKRWPMRWLYAREGRELLRYERRLATECDAALFVSQAEAGLFRELAPESASRIGFFNNGVDCDYFSPNRDYVNPYEARELPIVFTGAMDYWPNIDAVRWFARDVFPAILKRHPNAVFYIVGTRPSSDVQLLAQLPNVRVTGAVPDIRPYLAHAQMAVAPLRIARGVQNKVLEAMAMAKPVIVSPQALEGIDAMPDRDLLLAANEKDFVEAASRVLGTAHDAIGAAARECVQMRYGWEPNLARVDAALGTPVAARKTRPGANQAASAGASVPQDSRTIDEIMP